MELAPILILGGLVIFAWLSLSLRHAASNAPAAPADLLPGVPTGGSEGVLVARGRGQLIYANPTIRRWLGIDEGEPDLEFVARAAEPRDSFLELFAGADQASLRFGGRWVEATAYRVPAGAELRTVVVMREPGAAPARDGALDLSLALSVLDEIGATINASLGVEQVLQALLTIVRKAIPADAGEICLWDEARGVLVPRGWVGDVSYVLSLAEAGGVYHPGEGITGWVARFRQPLLIADSRADTAIRPKLEASPYRSFVAVPLSVGDRFIGTFELASERVGGLAQRDLALLQAISRQLVTVIDNAELYAAQVRRIDDIAGFQSIAGTPKTRDDVARVYQALGERLAKLLGAEVGGVLLYDERKAALVAEPPFYGLPAQIIASYAIPLQPGNVAYDIFHNRDYWLSNDLADEPLVENLHMTTLVHGAGLANTALVPMQIGDARVGMIQVGNKRAYGGFTTHDMQSLRVLAAQAAVVVENLRLYQTEQRLDTELAGLQEMTNALGALRHEGEFYSDIAGRVARVMGVEIAGILLYDESGHRLISRLPWYGVADSAVADYAIEPRPGTGIEQIWKYEDTWFSNRVSTDPLLHEAGLVERLQAMGVSRTLLAVLTAGGRRLGMIQVANKLDGADFTEKDARLLLIFGTQAAAMIENARLYREAQRRADEAESVRRVAELAGAILTGADSFVPVLQEIARLTESPVVFINTLSTDSGALVTDPGRVYGVALDAPIVQDIYGKFLERSVAVSRRPYLSNNLRADTGLPVVQALAGKLHLTRALLVPLAVGERGLGELGIANRATPYTDDDRRLLMALAIQLAAALERVRLHEATGQNLSRRLHELDAIARISNELTLTVDFDRVLDVIYQEAMQATEATGGTVALLRPDGELLRRVGDDLGLSLTPIERDALAQGTEPVRVDREPGDGAGAGSAVAAAIVYADTPIGVLHLVHDAPGHFDPQAAAFVATLAAKASLGYASAERFRENVERSQSLRRRVGQLNQIFELGQVLHHNIEPDVMLEAMAYAVQQSAGFDVVLMALADDEAGVVRRVAQAGMRIDEFEASRAKTLPLASLERLLDDEFRVSESYFFPLEKVSRWYVEGVQALGTAFDGQRSLYPRASDHWHDGDMLIVPLRAATGDILGLMSLDRPTDNHRPDRATIEILEIFAHQASITLENARLFRQLSAFADELNRRVEERTVELQQERDRLDALYRITSELARTLDVDRVFSSAVEMVARAVEADEGAILLKDPATAQLRPRAVYPDPADQPLAAAMLGEWLLHDGPAAVVIPDLLATAFWDASRPGAGQWRSALAVVLENETETQGAMIFLSRRVGAFFEPQVRLVSAAAAQVVTAINNADLYTLIRDQAERLGSLLRAEQEEAEKSAAILESIADGVVLADAASRIILVNNAAERILDVPRDQLLNAPFARLAHLFADSSAVWLDTLAGQTPGVTPTETLIERLQIGSRVVSARLSPVVSADRFIGTVAVFRDITRDVEVDRIKSDFIANVSHELRTPMTSIKGYADLLLMGAAGDLADRQKQFIHTIKVNADRLATLVDDLLNISRLDTGRERLRLEDVDVAEVLSGMVDYLNSRVESEGKALAITLDVAPDLPPLRADRSRLIQILGNLADNAFNYTYAGGRVEFSAARRADRPHVLIAVRDTGIGIPPEFQPRVWDRFERYDAHALVMDVAGTGLGLPIARQLVEMHGGEIWFESLENKGTTFYVSLPLSLSADGYETAAVAEELRSEPRLRP